MRINAPKALRKHTPFLSTCAHEALNAAATAAAT